MYNYNVKAHFPETLRGVTTEVCQTLDVGSLSDKDLKRVLNAVKRGRVPTSGFVHGIATICAEHLGSSRPLSIIKRKWNDAVQITGLPKGVEEHHFRELMKLSDVRMQMYLADNPAAARRYYHTPKAQFLNYGESHGRWLTLPGWQTSADVTACQKHVMEVLSKAAPQFKEDMQKLHDFIASKPKFVKRTVEKR